MIPAYSPSILILLLCVSYLDAFQLQKWNQQSQLIPSKAVTPRPHYKNYYTTTSTTTTLKMGYNNYGDTMGRSSSRYRKSNDRSKRQERVGHLVRTELASIFQNAYSIKTSDKVLEEDLMRRINVVNADVSPDLRQARITVSIIQPPKVQKKQEDDDNDDMEYDNSVVAKRRIYSWLVRNTKPIRHVLAQRLKYMKTVPNLTFAQADVGAAVDVMYLIDKVSEENYKREDIGSFDFLGGMDDDDHDDIWEDEDNDDEDGEGDGWVDVEF